MKEKTVNRAIYYLFVFPLFALAFIFNYFVIEFARYFSIDIMYPFYNIIIFILLVSFSLKETELFSQIIRKNRKADQNFFISFLSILLGNMLLSLAYLLDMSDLFILSTGTILYLASIYFLDHSKK